MDWIFANWWTQIHLKLISLDLPSTLLKQISAYTFIFITGTKINYLITAYSFTNMCTYKWSNDLIKNPNLLKWGFVFQHFLQLGFERILLDYNMIGYRKPPFYDALAGLFTSFQYPLHHLTVPAIDIIDMINLSKIK